MASPEEHLKAADENIRLAEHAMHYHHYDRVTACATLATAHFAAAAALGKEA